MGFHRILCQGPVLFNMLMNYMDARIERFLFRCTDYTKLGRTANTLESRITIFKRTLIDCRAGLETIG